MTNFTYNTPYATTTIQAVNEYNMLRQLIDTKVLFDINYNKDILDDLLQLMQDMEGSKLLGLTSNNQGDFYHFLINEGSTLTTIRIQDNYCVVNNSSKSFIITRTIERYKARKV